MRFKSYLLLILSVLFVVKAHSQLFDGRDLSQVQLNQLIDRITPGTVLLLGENHGLAPHRDQHMQVLEALRAKGLKVSVGLEFVNYTDQSHLNLFRQGELSEADFLKAIKWSGFGFEYYRAQLLFPQLERGEKSLGLNIPRSVTSKIARQGLAQLTPEEWQLMPPDFQLGRDSYKQRFMEAAGHHCKVPDNCFAAQCAWDDTMAWQAGQFITQNPDQILAVVVGEFHVQYGGGIKHRLSQRHPQVKVVTLSQIWAEGFSDEDLQKTLEPSAVEGERADFIWVSGR